MFCPVCRDEFRPGFTRCANCDVELVGDLAEADARVRSEPLPEPAAAVPMAEYCGFLDLDEARGARGQLGREGIRVDILIREVSGETGAADEEYWLRVEARRVREAAAILGDGEN